MYKKRCISAKLLERLKKETELTLDRKIESHSDCELLAESMLEATGRRVGITTLRRFFGIDPASTLPSVFTLDTFCIFCGYKSWQHYCDPELGKAPAPKGISGSDLRLSKWDLIAERAKTVSNLTLSAVKNKTGMQWENTIERVTATNHIISFVRSTKTATAFIAPGGYGKTTMLAKAAEKLWFGDDPMFPNDIVWYIDATVLHSLVSAGYDLTRWIAGQLGLDSESNYREYFLKHPEQVRGRMIIIIDSVEDLISDSNKETDLLTPLISLIATNEKTPWFKIVLAMRNIVWNRLVSVTSDYPYLQSCWYGVAFRVYKEESTNLPPFDLDELCQLSEKAGKDLPEDVYESMKRIILSGDLNHVISLPYFFRIFLLVLQERGSLPASDTELVIEFMRTKVCSSSLAEEKHMIIQAFLKETNYGLKGKKVRKSKLIKDIYFKNNLKAYQELLSYGILWETIYYNDYGAAETHVEFTHKILLDFIIAANFAQRSEKISISTFESVFNIYEHSDLKLDIVAWLLKLAFHNEEYDVIFNFKKILRKDTYLKKNEYDRYVNEFWQVIRTIGTCLRYNPQAREELIPRFAADLEWQEWYFETFVDVDYLIPNFGKSLLYYLMYKRTPESMLFGHALLLYKNLIELDLVEAKKHFKILESIDHDPESIHPVLLGRSFGYSLIYYQLTEGAVPQEFLDKIMRTEQVLYDSCRIPEYVPAFHASIMVGMNHIGKFDVTIYLWERLQEKFSEYMNLMRIPEVELAKIAISNAYLAYKEYDKAEEIIKTYSGNFYNTTRNSSNIYYCAIMARLNMIKGNQENGLKFIKQALFGARQFGMKLMEQVVKNTFDNLQVVDN